MEDHPATQSPPIPQKQQPPTSMVSSNSPVPKPATVRGSNSTQLQVRNQGIADPIPPGVVPSTGDQEDPVAAGMLHTTCEESLGDGSGESDVEIQDMRNENRRKLPDNSPLKWASKIATLHCHSSTWPTPTPSVLLKKLSPLLILFRPFNIIPPPKLTTYPG